MKRPTTKFTCFLVASILLCYGCAMQQTVKKESANEYALTPERIARTHFEMLRNKQWIEIAHLYDPEELSDIREIVSIIFESPDEVSAKYLDTIFGPGTTKVKVEAMTDYIFFANFLRFVMEQTDQWIQNQFKEIDILGSVKEGDNLVHVVSKMQIAIDDTTMESIKVVSFKKVGNEWHILLRGEIKGLIQQMMMSLQQEQ